MPMKLRNRGTLIVGLLVLLVAVGTVGFHAIQGFSWFESFYVTLMTISTIGSKPEDLLSHRARIFNVLVIFLGLILVGFALGSFTRAVIEFELASFFGRRRMEKEIARLKDHYIAARAAWAGASPTRFPRAAFRCWLSKRRRRARNGRSSAISW